MIESSAASLEKSKEIVQSLSEDGTNDEVISLKMAESNRAVDVDLFKNLNHVELAKHVFPDSFEGSGENIYQARKVCVEQITRVFKKCMKLNVQAGFSKWETKEFYTLDGVIETPESANIIRCNIQNKVTCKLYCSDCRRKGICCPIAKISFVGGRMEKEDREIAISSASVYSLFFHNSHKWRWITEELFGAGFVRLRIPTEFITRNIYDNAIDQGRILLHEEMGENGDSLLGIKNAEEKEVEKEYAFEFIQGEEVNSRAYMMASNATNDWKRRHARKSFGDHVNVQSHVSNMVRLYYCVSTQLGICKGAAPFDVLYSEKMELVGKKENASHQFFFQEESILVGGFVKEGGVRFQRRHTDYHDVSVFHPLDHDLFAVEDGTEFFRYGMSIITSLLKDEERVVYMGGDKAKVTVRWNQTLVFMGNLPHGGVTHQIEKDCRKIWPALHIHMDKESRFREQNTLGLVEEGTYCLDDNFHSDNNESGSSGEDESRKNSSDKSEENTTGNTSNKRKRM